MQYHSDGRSAGHGVVIYETIEDAEKALASTNGYRLEGRTIEVTPLRLKKLPSKLEHLKNRIKRQPLSGDVSGSEDGSGSIPACSPKSIVGTPPTPAAAAAAAALMGLTPQQQQAAAAALHLQQGFMQGLQLQQQHYFMQQMQQQMAMQQMGLVPPQPPVNTMAAAAAAAAAAASLAPGGMGGVHHAMAAGMAAGLGVPGVPGGLMPGGVLPPAAGMPIARPNADGVVPPGLDLSFIS